MLHRFADAHGIAYPLLADEGGKVIDRFGLLNPNIPPNPRQAPGIPFPGHFLLAPDGRTLAKSFTGDLRHRASGAALVIEQFGGHAAPGVEVEAQPVTAHIALASDELFGGQETTLVVDVDIAPGWHVYGAQVPPPYTPLAVELDNRDRLLVAQSFSAPEAKLIRFAALGETLPVHEGRLRITGRIRLRWSPPPSLFRGVEDAVRRRAIEPGPYELRGTLRFQACDDSTCLPPHAVPFALPITVKPTVMP